MEPFDFHPWYACIENRGRRHGTRQERSRIGHSDPLDLPGWQYHCLWRRIVSLWDNADKVLRRFKNRILKKIGHTADDDWWMSTCLPKMLQVFETFF